jgi:hypothetical protein
MGKPTIENGPAANGGGDFGNQQPGPSRFSRRAILGGRVAGTGLGVAALTRGGDVLSSLLGREPRSEYEEVTLGEVPAPKDLVLRDKIINRINFMENEQPWAVYRHLGISYSRLEGQSLRFNNGYWYTDWRDGDGNSIGFAAGNRVVSRNGKTHDALSDHQDGENIFRQLPTQTGGEIVMVDSRYGMVHVFTPPTAEEAGPGLENLHVRIYYGRSIGDTHFLPENYHYPEKPLQDPVIAGCYSLYTAFASPNYTPPAG